MLESELGKCGILNPEAFLGEVFRMTSGQVPSELLPVVETFVWNSIAQILLWSMKMCLHATHSNLIDFMELPVPAGYLAFNHAALIVVEGNLEDQLKHLKLFQVVDDTTEQSFAHLSRDIESTVARTIAPATTVELDASVLNAASSAGVEFAQLGLQREVAAQGVQPRVGHLALFHVPGCLFPGTAVLFLTI